MADETKPFILNRALYTDESKTQVLEEDDPNARFVIGGAGSTVDAADVEKYGLGKSHRQKEKPVASAAKSDDEAVAQIESKEEAAADDLESLTVVELKERAKEAGITGYSAMNKAELVEALAEAEE